MSRANIETVRRVYSEVGTDRAWPAELFDPDYELDVTETTPDVGVALGAPAALEFLRTYIEMFDDYEVELRELIYASEVLVVTAVRDRGRMKGSGAQVSNAFFHVWTFRYGKIARVSTHTDRSRALAAAGLAE